VVDVAESVLNLPTRLGKPHGISGLVDVVNNPMYATAVGLVIFGAKNRSQSKFRIRDSNIFNRVTARMKKWFQEII
jgi:cell division protein FtsA